MPGWLRRATTRPRPPTTRVSIGRGMRLQPLRDLRAAALRRGTATDSWTVYLREVEPVLAAHPRVHRFASPPVLSEPGLAATPAAVWLEGDGPGGPTSRATASLQAGTCGPTQIVGGPLREALERIRDERVVLMRAGDELAPVALERLGQAASLVPDAAVITTDDDALTPSGARQTPRLRPGPSPDRWLACDDSGPLLMVDRRRTLDCLAVIGSGPGWRHRLALVLAGPRSERHAHVPMLLCHREPVPDPGRSSSEDVGQILAGWEANARVEAAGRARRVRRPVAGDPRVEVIICFRDRPELLARCVDSLRTRSEFERLHVALVDNGSVETETHALLDRVGSAPNTRILRDPRPFHFAALNNVAAGSSDADVLVFLNNDTEVIDGDWIETLLEEAVRPEVGAVAPMLLYGDGTVQHAGAAIGLHGYAGHPFAGLAPSTETPFGHAAGGTRNWLAVTAACLMVGREKFLAVGGFDESFVVAGNDVDLGLRLTANGHRSLCVPHARLLHEESRSRGAHIDPGDFTASERSYGAFRTVGDPFYNPSLTLSATDCSLRGSTEGLA